MVLAFNDKNEANTIVCVANVGRLFKINATSLPSKRQTHAKESDDVVCVPRQL